MSHYTQKNYRTYDTAVDFSSILCNYFCLQEDLDSISPRIMKLGLLFETGADVASVRQRPTFVCFSHKLLQEYSGSYFLSKFLDTVPNIQVKVI